MAYLYDFKMELKFYVKCNDNTKMLETGSILADETVRNDNYLQKYGKCRSMLSGYG